MALVVPGMIMKRLTFLISLGLAVPVLGQETIDFEKQVVPILRDTCLQCHGGERVKGRLRLDNKADAMKGGSSGTVIEPGNPDASELYRRIILPKDDIDIMPSEGDPLTPEQTEIIKAWIAQGAPWPDDFRIEAAPAEVADAGAAADDADLPPEPKLPGDFKPGPGEAEAIAALAGSGIHVRPVAQNTPWHEANFRLQGSGVTDETIAPIGNIQSLIDLNLANTSVTDAGLAVLERLPYLMTLHLELTGITDAGLKHVAGLTNLVYLNLYGTKVSDAGLEHLHGLKHLRNLYLWQSQVTPEGAQRLRAAMPWVDVNIGSELSPPADNSESGETEKTAS